MKFIHVLLLSNVFIFVFGCDNSDQSPQPQSSTNPGEIIIKTCETNHILIYESCVCPAELIENNGICTDIQKSVLVGAEYLKPGFPLNIDISGGVYNDPIYLKVGNIDLDPELELIFKAGTSSLWAWNHDGSVIDGWPIITYGHGKLLLAQLDDSPEKEVVFASVDCLIYAFTVKLQLLPGWPLDCGVGELFVPPTASNINNDVYDEIMYFNGTWELMVADRNAVQTDITPLTPPEIYVTPPRKWASFSSADINKDGTNEIIAVTEPFPDRDTSPGHLINSREVYVIDVNGNNFPGFPFRFRSGLNTQAVIGDVDGDGDVEIIVAGLGSLEQFNNDGILTSIKIISKGGMLKNEINFTSGGLGSGYLELADLDDNLIPEILFTLDGLIQVYKASGDSLSGWPAQGGEYFSVGDVDGDSTPDVVTLLKYASPLITDNRNILTIYDKTGVKKNINVVIDFVGRSGGSIMPVIADLDLDGKNEVIVVGDYFEGEPGYFPQVWAFNFGGSNHGLIQWGQMFGDDNNSGSYLPH